MLEKQLVTKRQAIQRHGPIWHRLIVRFFLAAGIILTIITPISVPGNAAVPPALEQLPVDPTDTLVRVMVQAAPNTPNLKAGVEALGGRILYDLSIIQALAVLIPAKQTPRLASLPGVRWVMLDAPVVRADNASELLLPYRVLLPAVMGGSTPANEARSIIQMQATATITEATTWDGDWVESDPGAPSANSAGGDVQVIDNTIQLTHQLPGDEEPSIERPIDLAGDGLMATLHFQFTTTTGVDSQDGIAVEVSKDGGATYILLDTLAGIDGAASATRSYDISAWASAHTRIRFKVAQGYDQPQEYMQLKEVQVTTAAQAGPMTPHQTMADDFEAVPAVWDNNSGQQNWTSAWQEIGENDGTNAGNIRVVEQDKGLRLKLGATRTTGQAGVSLRGVQRMLTLPGNSQAQVSFLYARHKMETGDALTVGLSTNGGQTWTTVGQVEGQGSPRLADSDPGWRHASYNISSFSGQQITLRLIGNFAEQQGNSSSANDSHDAIYLDEIKVTYNAVAPPYTSTDPLNYFLETTNVRPVWNMGIKGAGVTVAVVDSGVALDEDFSVTPGDVIADRILIRKGFNQTTEVVNDAYGHGTHVAGIVGGNGAASGGLYSGIAPQVNLIGVKVSDDQGMAYESDTVAALQWILEQKDTYNIRVVNLSLNSTAAQSYHTSPLDAATEVLWFNGIVVIASAGNSGVGGAFNTVQAAPANDPFIITVGASEEHQTPWVADDTVAAFSAYGATLDGFIKPEIVAPGKDIVSVLARSSWWRNDYPERMINGEYFRISGTSMSAPMVAGAIALLLQAEPNLTPDQVKYRLIHASNQIQGYNNDPTLYPYLNIYMLLTTPTTESANTNLVASQLLWSGSDPITWSSVNWNSVNWNSVNWNSVNWNSVNWNSVNWNSVNWAD